MLGATSLVIFLVIVFLILLVLASRKVRAGGELLFIAIIVILAYGWDWVNGETGSYRRRRPKLTPWEVGARIFLILLGIGVIVKGCLYLAK